MKAEQTTFSKFWMSHQPVAVEVQITIRFELTSAEGNVGTTLSYEPKFPESWQVQDELHQKLFNGVHEGLASVDLPLPKACLEFDITELHISKSLEEMPDEDVQHIGDLLLELVRWMVAALWSGNHEFRDSN